jgi:hypothetical protein
VSAGLAASRAANRPSSSPNDVSPTEHPPVPIRRIATYKTKVTVAGTMERRSQLRRKRSAVPDPGRSWAPGHLPRTARSETMAPPSDPVRSRP